MQTKTYFASSVPAALEVARQELGEEALLVGSRPAPPQARQFGRLEVIFAWDPQAPADPATKSMPFVPDKTPRNSSASQGAEIRRQLIGNGFSAETAAEIAAGAARKPGDADAAVIHELTSRIPTVASVGVAPGESRTVAFIGPPGRGKTTSLVKVAMSAGLSRGIPVRTCTAGAHCTGAQEQMARFAAILGTAWRTHESPASLNLALNGDGWKGLALIDTPGISPADINELSELGRFFAARPDIEKHLVLRADATTADMLHMVSRFSSLAPTRLLFTGLDEAVSAAPMIETLLRSGIPAAYVGTGQRIPEDLEEVDAERLARSAWTGGGASSTIKRARFALAAA